MTLFPVDIERTAVISDCGIYRYSLTRRWGPGKLFAAFIMLNPSTADATVDDPTIRRCIGFAKDWGYDALSVVNLFALRSPNPRDLRDNAEAGIDPIGPENNKAIADTCSRAAACIAAWGAHEYAKPRARQVLKLDHGGILECLGLNGDGTPKHPLYVPADQRRVRFKGFA